MFTTSTPWWRVVLGALAAGVLMAAIGMSGTRASTVTKCPPGAYSAYYVLIAEPVAPGSAWAPSSHAYGGPTGNLTRFTEFHTVPGDIPVFYAMCSTDAPAFETSKGIHPGDSIGRGPKIQQELQEVVDSSENPVGVVWHDKYQPFDQGGGIIGQSYWDCGGTPVVDNFAAFSSGLDVSAINGTGRDDAVDFYLRHIRERVMVADQRDMELQGCARLPDKQALVEHPNYADLRIWYRSGDPS